MRDKDAYSSRAGSSSFVPSAQPTVWLLLLLLSAQHQPYSSAARREAASEECHAGHKTFTEEVISPLCGMNVAGAHVTSSKLMDSPMVSSGPRPGVILVTVTFENVILTKMANRTTNIYPFALN